MSTTSENPRGDDAVDELAAAHDRVERLREELELDRDALDGVADAYESVERVLDRWEERATDWDDFEGYVEFRDDLSATLESIPEDVPASEAFVAADGHVKTGGVSKSLKSRDFEAAREALQPAREYAERREAIETAREHYRDACQTARARREELADRVADLERLLELGAADLDAPVEVLREPIDRYDEAVREAVADFRRTAPAREFLGFVATASGYPLVDYDAPPADLLRYVRERPAGRHPVDDLLEYAGYSPSKLDHYVDDGDLLKRHVATNRTYLEGLSPEPLTVEWPPRDREALRFRSRELVSLVDRFADDDTVAALRDVRELTYREDYGRLRAAAVARSELTDEERKRVEGGAVEADLETARERLDRLRTAIEEYA